MMKKRLLSLLLVCVMLLGVFPVTALADGTSDAVEHPTSVTVTENGVTLNKSVTETPDSSGNYTLTMEAYVGGTVTSTSAKPMDIVLVLDQSGSMSEKLGDGQGTRQAALKTGVTNFINAVAASSASHRMAIVTFGSSANTLAGWTAMDSNNVATLTSKIASLKDPYNQATRVDLGMEKAQELLNTADETHDKTVIVFTDGVPTASSDFSVTVADSAISSATAIKTSGVAVYTIGIFDGANPDQLYGAKFDNLFGVFDRKCNGTVGSYWGVSSKNAIIKSFFNDFNDWDIPAGNRFLNYLSSNYTANVIGIKEYYGLTTGMFGGGWKITDASASGSNQGYYKVAADADSLNTIFTQLAGSIVPNAVLNATTVLTDTLSEYFVFPEGAASSATVEVHAASGTGETASWTKVEGTSLTATIFDKTIFVSGFNYSANPVVKGTNGWSGQKLVLTFNIQTNPDATWNAGKYYYPTNNTTGSKAGLGSTQLTKSPEVPIETASTYTLTYDPNGGYADSVPAQDLNLAAQTGYPLDSTTVPTHADVDKNKVVFIGWTADQDTNIYAKGDTAPTTIDKVDISSDVTVYAVWGYDKNGDGTPDVLQSWVTITYDANDGAWENAVTGYEMSDDLKQAQLTKVMPYAFEGLLAYPNVPSRDGYTFTGWYEDADCKYSATISVGQTVPWNFTLYAGWVESNTPEQGKLVSITVKEHYRLDGEAVFNSSVPNSIFLDTQTYADVITALKGTGTRTYNGRTYTYTKATVNNVSTYSGNIADNDVIDLYFDCTTGKATYTIEYYRLGEDTAFETTTGAAQTIGTVIAENDAYVLNQINANTLTGYHLKYVQTLPLTISATAANNVIKVVYEKDYFDYTIEYYYDGVLDRTKTELLSAQYGDEITSYPDKAGLGYVLDHVTPVPLVISHIETNNVLKVYYKSCGYTVTKTVDKTTAKVGDTLTYTITVKNTGKTDLRLTVTDSMLNFEETISLTAGNTWTKVLTYKTTKAGTLVNTVVVAHGNDKTTVSSDPTKVSDNTSVVTPSLNKKDHVAYIIGYEDLTVRPENNITRAEVATIFFRLMDDSSRSHFWSQKNDFSDVSKSDWFNNAVSTMANAGILSGYPDGTFKPNAPITRAEFSAIAARFSDVVYGGKSSFSDVAKTFWAYDEIALAEHLGWITGYPDGTFQPGKNITRAEAMTMINRVLERAVEQEHMLKDMVHWTDNNPNAWYYEAVQEATNSHTYTRLNKKVSGQNFNYEDWIKILENPDWAALEKSWSKN